MLGELAETVLKRYRGDLRRLRDESNDIERDVQQFKGIGRPALPSSAGKPRLSGPNFRRTSTPWPLTARSGSGCPGPRSG